MTRKSNLPITRKIRKDSYKILQKMHALEHTTKRAKLLAYQTDGVPVPFILLTTKHLVSCLQSCLNQVNEDDYLKPATISFLRQLTNFCSALEKQVSERQKFPKKMISRLLQSHTKLFNRLNEKEVQLCINDQNNYDFTYAFLSATSIWGNSL